MTKVCFYKKPPSGHIKSQIVKMKKNIRPVLVKVHTYEVSEKSLQPLSFVPMMTTTDDNDDGRRTQRDDISSPGELHVKSLNVLQIRYRLN